MSVRPIRVFCADDNAMVASAMERYATADPRFLWVGWLPDTDRLVEQVRQTQPHVVLLDIDIPGRDPFALVQELAAAFESVRVLMFSAYVRQDYIDRAVETGAWGYVSKNEGVAEVFNAIERAADGEFVLTDDALREQRQSQERLEPG